MLFPAIPKIMKRNNLTILHYKYTLQVDAYALGTPSLITDNMDNEEELTMRQTDLCKKVSVTYISVI